jgi:hypothetical protein
VYSAASPYVVEKARLGDVPLGYSIFVLADGGLKSKRRFAKRFESNPIQK